MKKVQRSAASAITLLLACTIGCTDASQSENGSEGAPAGRFGSAYEIITNTTPAEPDEPPAILSDSLSVMVSYAGGCADHEFELASSVSGDSARLWLRHDASGDDCEALIRDRLTFALPPRVLAAQQIELLNPNAEVPFVLKWAAAPGRQPSSSDTT